MPALVDVDSTCVAAHIVTGVGFLGAGVIIKHGADIVVLNSVTTLWVSTAIGCLTAVGMYTLAVVGTLLI